MHNIIASIILCVVEAKRPRARPSAHTWVPRPGSQRPEVMISCSWLIGRHVHHLQMRWAMQKNAWMHSLSVVRVMSYNQSDLVIAPVLRDYVLRVCKILLESAKDAPFSL